MEVYGSDGIDVEGLRWWMGCFGTVGEFDSRQCRGVACMVTATVWPC